MWLKGSKYQPTGVPGLESSSYFSRGDRVSIFEGICSPLHSPGLLWAKVDPQTGILSSSSVRSSTRSCSQVRGDMQWLAVMRESGCERAISLLTAVFRAPSPHAGVSSILHGCVCLSDKLCFQTSRAKHPCPCWRLLLRGETGAPGDAHRLTRGWYCVWEGKGKPCVRSKWEMKKCQPTFSLCVICIPFWRL